MPKNKQGFDTELLERNRRFREEDNKDKKLRDEMTLDDILRSISPSTEYEDTDDGTPNPSEYTYDQFGTPRRREYNLKTLLRKLSPEDRDKVINEGEKYEYDSGLPDNGRTPSSEENVMDMEGGTSWQDTPEGKYKKLKDFLSSKESGGDYDIANKPRNFRLTKPTSLTSRTIGDILNSQNKKDIFAAGKYQVTPNNLKYLLNKGVIDKSDIYDEQTQEEIADALIKTKRSDIDDYLIGKEDDIHTASKSAAKEWASLPVTEKTRGFKRPVERGESYYAGGKFDRAHHSPEELEDILKEAREEAQGYLAKGMYHAGTPDWLKEKRNDEEERRIWNIMKGLDE